MNSKILFASIATLVIVFGAAAFVIESDAVTSHELKETDFDWVVKGENVNLVIKMPTGLEFNTATYTVNGETEIIAPFESKTPGEYRAFVSKAADKVNDTIEINLLTKDLQNQYVFSNEKFAITTNAQNGTITPSVEKAQKGETVTFTAVPSEGYELSGVPTVNGVKATETETGYSFVMPGEAVTISATFTEKPSYNVIISEDITN